MNTVSLKLSLNDVGKTPLNFKAKSLFEKRRNIPKEKKNNNVNNVNFVFEYFLNIFNA